MKIARSADSLVIETGRGGFNGVSGFPLLLGGLLVVLGGLCLVSASTRGSGQSLAIAVPALALGAWVGRIGVRLALQSHRIELSRTTARIVSGGDGGTAIAEAPLRNVRLALLRGRAWEVGLLPQWHQWQRVFVRLSIECGGRRVYLLDGAPDRQKEQAHEAIRQWLQ